MPEGITDIRESTCPYCGSIYVSGLDADGFPETLNSCSHVDSVRYRADKTLDAVHFFPRHGVTVTAKESQ